MLKPFAAVASSALALLALQGAAFAAPADVPTATSPPFIPTYYTVTRPDLRKCAAPLCGGYFVKAVNRATTRCADGSLQKDCHVFSLDTGPAGWTPEQAAAFQKAFAPGHAIVSGSLRATSSTPRVDTLTVFGGWVGQAQSKPLGVFAHLKNNGVVCVTFPCPSVNEAVLNYPLKRTVDGVDLAASGASPEQVEAGSQALFDLGLLAAGYHKAFTGPAGQGQTFVATEFYLSFPGKPAP